MKHSFISFILENYSFISQTLNISIFLTKTPENGNFLLKTRGTYKKLFLLTLCFWLFNQYTIHHAYFVFILLISSLLSSHSLYFVDSLGLCKNNSNMNIVLYWVQLLFSFVYLLLFTSILNLY